MAFLRIERRGVKIRHPLSVYQPGSVMPRPRRGMAGETSMMMMLLRRSILGAVALAANAQAQGTRLLVPQAFRRRWTAAG